MWQKIFTTVKYALCTINLLFVITGIVILSVGSSVQRAYNGYHEFLTDRFFSLPAFCIATGVIIFLIALAGFYGALTENYMINMGYAGGLVIIFIFQLSACIAGFALKGNTIALIESQLTDTMTLYGADKSVEITILWDSVQEDFECCGVRNASDWLVPLEQEDNGVPISCCKPIPGTVHTMTCTVAEAMDTGCAEAFGNWARSHVGSIAVAGIFMVLMQGAAAGGAVYIAKKSRDETYIP